MHPHRTPQTSKSTALTCCPDCTKSPIIVETPLCLHTQLNPRNMHCPLCGEHPSAVQPTDVYHVRAMSMDVPYNAIKCAVSTLADYFTANPSRRHHTPSQAANPRHPNSLASYNIPNPQTDLIAFEDYLLNQDKAQETTFNVDVPAATYTSKSAYVCYVNGHCSTCGASFTITRNTYSDPDDLPDGNDEDAAQAWLASRTPDGKAPCGYQYCPFCGSSTITITPTSTEDTAWQVLAQVYNMPVPGLQALYDIWMTDSAFNTSHTFTHYLNSFASKVKAQA